MDLLNTFYLTQQLLPVFSFWTQSEKTAYIHTYLCTDTCIQQCKFQMGFQPMTICDLVNCFKHLVTGDSLQQGCNVCLRLRPHYTVLLICINQ